MSKPWSNLAKVVTKRTYCRKDKGPTEGWMTPLDNSIIERVIAGNVRNFDVPEQEINRLRFFMAERKALPGGRGLWMSGAPAHDRLGGAALNNCFDPGTRFFVKEDTEIKLRSFNEFEHGDKVLVLNEDGVWSDAIVVSMGRQPLNRITLTPANIRSNFRLTYRATPNHTWITRRGKVDDLRVGDQITVTPFTPNKDSEYTAGFVHGLVFADGTKNGTTKFTIRLCGPKTKFLNDILAMNGRVSYPASADGDPVIYLKSYRDLKRVPTDDCTLSYQRGFLEGWKALDGSTRGRLTSTDSHALEWVIERAPLLGFCVCGDSIYSNEETNYGKRNFPLRCITLTPEPTTYTVREIESDGEDTVWCVNEPATHTFTLDGGVTTGQCWFLVANECEQFVRAADLLMLGGGVGMSVEHKFVSQLPRVKRGVKIEHVDSNDADFIVPDKREGWCELERRVLEAYFVTGKGFTYTTCCIRGYGEPIKGFGGTASGPLPLIEFVKTLCEILEARAGRHVRPCDCADIVTATGAMVVAGNVRRSAIIILGDPFDKDYLVMKRWDLGSIPDHRGNANYSVVCEDIEDLHPLFWKTYEHGEPYGLVNRKNIQTYGRMGERKRDTAIGVNPCAEATLEPNEPCNLQEIALCNLSSVEEFVEAARLMHRYGKRVTCEEYHIEDVQRVIQKNRRVGTGITGVLNSKFWDEDILDHVYREIQLENSAYSKELGIPLSIRTTLVKPSGTLSKVMDTEQFEGIHGRDSRYLKQTIRFASNDPLIPLLRDAGHHMEPRLRMDGTLDHRTQVVDFYEAYEGDGPIKDEGFDTWKQLDTLLMAQKWWADQAVSVTVYYKREEIGQLKEWLANNFKYVKTISFLAERGHGFAQAPKQPISKEEYLQESAKIKPLKMDEIENVGDLESQECEGGFCPIK